MSPTPLCLDRNTAAGCVLVHGLTTSGLAYKATNRVQSTTMTFILAWQCKNGVMYPNMVIQRTPHLAVCDNNIA